MGEAYTAQVPAQRIADLLQQLMFVLRDAPVPVSPREAVESVRSRVTLTEFEQGKTDAGRDRFYNIFAFAFHPLKTIGWTASINYRWTITEDGRKALELFPDAMQFRTEAFKLYKVWQQVNKPLDAAQISEPPEISSEVIDKQADLPSSFLQETQDKADKFIADHLKKLSGSAFEQLMADLLEAMGYHIQWTATGGGDGGIDITATIDPLGVQRPHIKVQTKNWISTASASDIREFAGVLGEHDSGIFVCTGGFTGEALKEARRKGITTMDRHNIVRLWVQHSDKMTAHARDQLPLVAVYLLAPRE